MERYTIEQARKLSGKTQVQVAAELGMSEATYIKYEKGRSVFRMDDAFNFSKITGISIDRIIFLSDNYGKTVVMNGGGR
ncbi:MULTISPECIES: helix-turn-helix transcriptional regulator [Vagococcus]|uniref:helix-turn-helix transcriptional regulator n=1 Tax=Vagococcus TaxID=2737 RepID=UPI000E4A836B|nr:MULTISPECIES: helix-turn-helix transcriptional regulator [Vagococcus]RHH70122.1 XRE family transcriptional regulator [Vagococcus sp. AM17-17]